MRSKNDLSQLLKAYLTACTNYAVILYQQNIYPDALTYIEKAYAIETENNSLNYYYSRILQANQKDQEAFVIMDKIIRMGNVDEKIMDEFRSLYSKVKDSTDGYDAYITGVKKVLLKKSVPASQDRWSINPPILLS